MDVEVEGVFRLDYEPPAGSPGWDGPLYLYNSPTQEGINYLLNAGFRGGSAAALWYIGFIDDAGFTRLAPGDTLASHPGWNEFTSIFGGHHRVWSSLPPTGGFIIAPAVTSQLTASGSIRGAFLSTATNPGNSGILYSTSVDAVGKPILAGGSITIVYQLKLAGRS